MKLKKSKKISIFPEKSKKKKESNNKEHKIVLYERGQSHKKKMPNSVYWNRVRKNAGKSKGGMDMEPFGTIIAATELGSMLGGAIADLIEKSVKKGAAIGAVVGAAAGMAYVFADADTERPALVNADY